MTHLQSSFGIPSSKIPELRNQAYQTMILAKSKLKSYSLYLLSEHIPILTHPNVTHLNTSEV